LLYPNAYIWSIGNKSVLYFLEGQSPDDLGYGYRHELGGRRSFEWIVCPILFKNEYHLLQNVPGKVLFHKGDAIQNAEARAFPNSYLLDVRSWNYEEHRCDMKVLDDACMKRVIVGMDEYTQSIDMVSYNTRLINKFIKVFCLELLAKEENAGNDKSTSNYSAFCRAIEQLEIAVPNMNLNDPTITSKIWPYLYHSNLEPIIPFIDPKLVLMDPGIKLLSIKKRVT